MRIAAALKRYLDETGVEYELVEHPHSVTSRETAGAAGLDQERVAKAVVLEDRKRFLRRDWFSPSQCLHDIIAQHDVAAMFEEIQLHDTTP